MVVLNNVTGGVEAMVGGYDYRTQPFNLATQGHRQPGSAFKPFTLVTALEQGHSPDEVFTSAPQQIPFKAKIHKKGGGEKIVPEIFPVHNYGDSYLGSASIATATTYSDNSVYSQLGTQVGPANVAQTANKMGVQTDLSTPDVQYSINGGPFEPYNPALILGGLRTGVTPLEMAHAYQTLQHDGQIVSGTMADSPNGPIAIQNVQDAEGNLCRDQRRGPRAGPGGDQAGGGARDRRHRQRDPPYRGHVGNREGRLHGRPERMGQDGDDREQRRRLVRRRHQGRHRGRVGRARELDHADDHRVRRRPRGRGHDPGSDLQRGDQRRRAGDRR